MSLEQKQEKCGRPTDDSADNQNSMGKRPSLKYEENRGRGPPSPEKKRVSKRWERRRPGLWAETGADPWPIPALACRRESPLATFFCLSRIGVVLVEQPG